MTSQVPSNSENGNLLKGHRFDKVEAIQNEMQVEGIYAS